MLVTIGHAATCSSLVRLINRHAQEDRDEQSANECEHDDHRNDLRPAPIVNVIGGVPLNRRHRCLVISHRQRVAIQRLPRRLLQ